jgi:hypothetical protein
MARVEPVSRSRGPRDDSRVGLGLGWASVATELAGAFLIANEFLVLGAVALVSGLAMGVVCVRLLPVSHPRHGFAVGALKSTLLLLGIAVFLQALIWLSAASSNGER